MDILKRNEKSEKSKLKKRSTNVLEWRHRHHFYRPISLLCARPPRPPSLLPCALPFDIVRAPPTARRAHAPLAACLLAGPRSCTASSTSSRLRSHSSRLLLWQHTLAPINTSRQANKTMAIRTHGQDELTFLNFIYYVLVQKVLLQHSLPCLSRQVELYVVVQKLQLQLQHSLPCLSPKPLPTLYTLLHV